MYITKFFVVEFITGYLPAKWYLQRYFKYNTQRWDLVNVLAFANFSHDTTILFQRLRKSAILFNKLSVLPWLPHTKEGKVDENKWRNMCVMTTTMVKNTWKLFYFNKWNVRNKWNNLKICLKLQDNKHFFSHHIFTFFIKKSLESYDSKLNIIISVGISLCTVHRIVKLQFKVPW